MILVTGATGTVGGQVMSLLLQNGAEVRALSRDPDSARLPANVEVVRGDLGDPESITTAVKGVEAVFLVWPFPTSQPAPAVMEEVGKHARRIVLLSAGAIRDELERQVEPIGRLHAEVEQAILRSGMEWTFLRAYSFAANTLQWVPQIRAGDVVRGAYGRASMTLLHERDIAAVGVRALTEDGHAGRRHALTGPELLTRADQVRIIGEVIGRPLTWAEIPPEVAREQMLARLPAPFVEGVLHEQARAVTEPGPVTATIEEITGAPARTFREWVSDHAAAFR
ncbi:SDR family oxidoreductase [Thermomonospora umbrina]|uniref:Uncharacterized protein YbjT (DUF2867 family) n=1 Tax=Thermomonospora umbrina TaxID=111806 RepID=A0A3D9SP01_9ACTN|nr:NAD(P)H-binding protein [Thermomonospora umbrina]REE97347.1 uncharacterized protein YbjT (DUF2867 family) [Thermomonospora umbrina]